MGFSDDVTPVTKGFDDDIQQRVGALSSVSFHWKELQECVGGISAGFYGAGVRLVYLVSQ